MLPLVKKSVLLLPDVLVVCVVETEEDNKTTIKLLCHF